ncbi:PREDICTED: F-box/LRR-repeat protein 17 isoform X2 [Theobroma cacao]|uniref:F-box/LRR-repeat protein 17 isoform X2 n=1 Tax=Theobroma cacao TaxID=3641 RepID=A0AB32WBL3_THECC|nr:PREDICTED: F-box/LRR-repeat protein 17 isoform X2 [Theobroma cacao]
MHHPQPHISSSAAASAAAAAAAAFDLKPAKRRGSYNCGRCGLPKKGHVCQVINTDSTPTLTSTPTSTPATTTITDASSSAARPPHHPPRQPYSHLRRALSFDDIDIRCDSPELDLDGYDSPFLGTDLDPDNEIVSGGLPAGCLWEVLRRLPPAGLMAAARVCKGWRETTKRLWRAAEELRLRVPPGAQLGFIGSVLQKCPSLVRLSLKMESDVDATMLACIAFSCPNLESMEISTSETAVNRITGGLRMLSLVLGSEITDASVAAIASSYSRLELLDLSGSSISDSGIGMICNVFPNTLSRLLLALCPNITSSGIQFATAQLPLLELMDCGMTICDPNSQNSPSDESGNNELPNSFNSKLHLMYQKLIIKHSRLKKLSLWGCSGLDALCLNCPELNDLNLNSCKNLHPERLLLQCPSLQNVHASGCQELLIGAIEGQVSDNLASVENHFPCKRLADGSKRVRAPNFLSQQSSEDDKKRRRIVGRQCCNVLVD